MTKNNCPPVALNDTQTVRNDQILTGTLKPKVSDPDSDVLTLSLIGSPTRGQLYSMLMVHTLIHQQPIMLELILLLIVYVILTVFVLKLNYISTLLARRNLQ